MLGMSEERGITERKIHIYMVGLGNMYKYDDMILSDILLFRQAEIQ